MRLQDHHHQSSELPNVSETIDNVGNTKALQAVYSGKLTLDLESVRQLIHEEREES